MAVLPREASYGEFCAYVTGLNGSKSDAELLDLWEWRQKVLTVRVDIKRGWRAAKLTDDEQHLSRREIDTKRYAEAKSQGRNVEPPPAKATF